MILSIRSLNIKKFMPLWVMNFLILASCNNTIQDLKNDQQEVGIYFAYPTKSIITIDGMANEQAWNATAYSHPFVDILTGEESDLDTRVKVLYDNTYVYIFAKLKDTHIMANMTTPDTTLYNENCFEIFIDPDQDGLNYVELEINPLGTKFDLLLDKPYTKGGKANVEYTIENIQYAVALNGTLNNPSDIDNFWSIEIAIPIEQIQDLKTSDINDGLTSWRMHFARMVWPVNIVNGKYTKKATDKPEVLTWTQQSAFDNHLPAEWGTVIFSKD